MGEVISIISGKGGTGKTTVCAAVASCLAAEGKRVLCIDADIGLRNLDIALGMAELPAIAFTEVLRGEYTLSDAAVHPEFPNLSLLTAPERGEKIDPAAFAQLLRRAREEYDFCLLDSAAGIGEGFRLATQAAGRCVIVCTADPASMRDAACTADLLTLRGKQDLCLVVNRVSPRMFSRMALTVDDIMDTVGVPLLGIVPEDPEVVLAAAQGVALVLAAEDGAAEACLRISRRLRGEYIPLMKL